MRHTRRRMLAPIGILALAAVLAGCSRGSTTSAKGTGLSGTLSLTGSTTVLPIAQAAADQFKQKNPNVQAEVQGTGSSEGVTAVSAGAADIGDSSRDLKDEEKKLGLVDHVIAVDAIVFITHPSNRVDNLTKAQATGIFTGKIKNWKEVGGQDAPIEVINRDEASGTREAVQKMALGENAQFTKDAVVQPGTGQVKAAVASSPNAIGYISFGYVDQSVKGLSLDGAKASVEDIRNKSYFLQRNLHMFTKGEAKGLAKAFIDFVLTPSFQKDIVSQEYLPVVQ